MKKKCLILFGLKRNVLLTSLKHLSTLGVWLTQAVEVWLSTGLFSVLSTYGMVMAAKSDRMGFPGQ